VSRVGSARGLILAALAAIAAATAALAAGTEPPASTGDRAAPGEQAAVEHTVRAAVYAAVRHGNYRRACRFATPRGRRRLLEGFNSSSGPDYPSCWAIVADQVEAYPETVRKLRHDLVVSNIRVDGGRARVTVAEGPGPFAGGGHLVLVKVDGRWRLHNSDLIPYGD
jgi:hypothetical protein